MAISTIGGASAAVGGSTAPAGYKLQVGGYSSTGTYTATVPAGEYIFVGAAGSTLVCNGGTSYSGYNLYPGGFNTGSPNSWSEPVSSPINVGTPVKIMGTQSVTVNTGLLPTGNGRLGSRATGTQWNRNKVLWTGTKYAFADYALSSNTPVWTSTDGVSWTSNATTFVIGQCFTLANGIIFAGDNSNTNTFYTSTDATTWTARSFPTTTVADGKLVAVVYSGGKYVAFVRKGSTTYAVHTFTSTDAVTWTYGAAVSGPAVATNTDNGLYVAASSTTIVVTGDGAANTTFYYSTNGTTWTTTGQATGTTLYASGIEYVNGNFVVHAGNTAAANGVYYYSANATSGTWNSASTNMSYQIGYATTGINWDGTNYVITVLGSSQNANVTIQYGTTLGSLNNTGGTTPTGNAIIGNGYSTVNFNYGISASTYVNGKWFFKGNDFVNGSNSQLFGYLSTSFPVFKSPNTFALYRLGETAVLN